jgi:hypothetical protein
MWEVIALEVKVDGWNIRYSFRDNPGSVSGATELVVCLSASPFIAFANVSGLPERLV